jgi:WD40 repeat protein
VGLYPFGPVSDTLYGDAVDLDHALTFDRARIPVDDTTLSGDGQAVAILSGEVLEVWSAGPETGERGFSERIVLLEGVTQPEEGSPLRLELSHDGTTAVTSGGSTVQRWDTGRIEVTPEISFGGAMDAYIGVGVTESEVYWASDPIGAAPARLAFEDGAWEVLEGSAATEALQRIEDVFSDTDERPSPDGTLAARADDNVITLRRLPEREILTTLTTQADSGYLAFTPDGRHLVLASRGGGLEYWPLTLDTLCPALDLRVGPGTTAATCGTAGTGG